MQLFDLSNKITQTILTPELKQWIINGLAKHAIDQTGIDGLKEEAILFEIRDNQNLAGCVAIQIFWGQLHIKMLFVEENYRAQGFARALMEHAFEFGKTKRCNFAFVETMNFQAPDFYQKLGFKIDFIRDGYAKETSFYYLSKEL